MKFELSKENIALLQEAIAQNNHDFVIAQVTDLHAADIAEIFEELELEEAQFVFQLLEEEKAANVMVELEEDVREKFFEAFSSKEIAERVIDKIDSDVAADVISELPSEKIEEVISHIEDAEQASDIVDLLAYDEDTAGGLMAKELIKVNAKWTVSRCIRDMRKQAEEIKSVYTVYAVDNDDVLIGTLPLKKLLFSTASVNSTIEDVVDKDIISVHAEMDSEEVAKIMEKYDLVALPVVNDDGKLLGRITIDDVVDVIKEEAGKDYQMASGISSNVEARTGIGLMTKARLPWLLIGLLGGVLVAHVISIYEDQLKIIPQLAFFIPLIAGMGGNVGVQSSAIVVQGLANKSLSVNSIFAKLMKEFSVALINGLICASLILLYNILFIDSYALSYTVSLSLFFVIIMAAFFGTFIPLILDKLKFDPALATGPFITTLNDLLGLFIYFIVARLMYGY